MISCNIIPGERLTSCSGMFYLMSGGVRDRLLAVFLKMKESTPLVDDVFVAGLKKKESTALLDDIFVTGLLAREAKLTLK